MNNYRPFAGITPAVKIIIIINVLVFLAINMIGQRANVDLVNILGMHLPQSQYFQIYQYITHMFTQKELTHLFFNMFAVFMFGRILESVWGTQRFLIFYFVCGIGAGLLNSAVGWLEIHRLMEQYYAFQNAPSPALLAQLVERQLGHPAQWVWEVVDNWTNNPDSQQYIVAGKQLFRQIVELKVNVPMIGASGAIFGILLAFGMLFPNTELYLMFIPILIKAKYFVLGYGLLELFLGMQNSATDNVAHFAHLGGMLFGFFMVKYWSKNRRRFY